MPPLKKREPAEIVAELRERVSKIEIEKDVISKIVKDLLEGIQERDRKIEELKVEIAASKRAQLLKIKALLDEIQEVVKKQPVTGAGASSASGVDALDIDFLARKVAKKLESRQNGLPEKKSSGVLVWAVVITAVLAVPVLFFWYINR